MAKTLPNVLWEDQTALAFARLDELLAWLSANDAR
jgi:hypothetical protein